MKVLSVVLALSLMAGVACAENFNLDVPAYARDGNAQDFFTTIEGARQDSIIYDTTAGDTVDIDFDPTGVPGWFHLVIPEEATLTRGRIVFEEADGIASSIATQTYSWGDTVEFYIGEAAFDEWFHVSGWNSVHVRLVGSAAGWAEAYYWAEMFNDSE